MKRQVITIQEEMVIYAPHHGEVWMTVWEIAELLNVTGTAVKNTIKRIWKQSVLKDFQLSQYIKLENGYSAHVYDMEVIIAIALQMDTYQALLFRQWFISKVVNRKDCHAEQVKHEYPMIIVMNGTMDSLGDCRTVECNRDSSEEYHQAHLETKCAERFPAFSIHQT